MAFRTKRNLLCRPALLTYYKCQRCVAGGGFQRDIFGNRSDFSDQSKVLKPIQGAISGGRPRASNSIKTACNFIGAQWTVSIQQDLIYVPANGRKGRSLSLRQLFRSKNKGFGPGGRWGVLPIFEHG